MQISDRHNTSFADSQFCEPGLLTADEAEPRFIRSASRQESTS
jgi:hypothetical protein